MQSHSPDASGWRLVAGRATDGHALAFWLGCFLAALYFLPGGPLANIGPIAIALPALLALTLSDQQQRLKPLAGMAVFFLAAGLWAVGITIFNGGSGSDIERAVGNFLTLAFLAIMMGMFAAVRNIRVLLWMIFAFAATSAAISLALHVAEPQGRLIAIGRAVNPIPAAGGFAAGMIAAFVLWRMASLTKPLEGILLGGFVILGSALFLTGSRGPFLGVLAVLIIGPWLLRRASYRLVTTILLVAFGGLVAVILMEGWLGPLLCPISARLCSESHRLMIWGWTFDQIAASPFLGTGPHHRFTEDAYNHPHNGLFGLAMFYGIPFALISLALFVLALRRIIRDAAPLPRAWCIVSLIFTSAYIASDQSNIFAFFNTHYVFFWMPFLLAYASAVMPEGTDERTLAVESGAR